MTTHISERDLDVDEHLTVECAISSMCFSDQKDGARIRAKITKEM